MATAENIAIERRVEDLEGSITNQAGLLIRTTLVVYEREPEPEYLTVGEVLAAAERDPKVREVRRIFDLELLIDPIKKTRRLRHELSLAGQAYFDELKTRPGVRLIDVEISCHEAQVRAILSKAPTVAAFGGNRAGKTRILAWWLFRRWMLRGHVGATFWWIGPTIGKAIEEGAWGLAGPDGLGGGVWPDEVFTNLRRIGLTKRDPEIELVDGSKILFKHANHSGRGAGKNLKSANVTDAVVDELGAIQSPANWHQVQVRVSQSGGHVATATTRVTNHWSHEEISKRAEEVGPDVIDVSTFDLTANPWMSYARIWQLFLSDRTLTRQQLESIVLPAEDKVAACLSVVTQPKSLREHFGIETATDPRMWQEWSDDLIYTGPEKWHQEIFVRGKDGEARRLINITREVMAGKWPNQHAEGRSFDAWGGVDFNVRGHAVIMEIFGAGRSVHEALANEASWTVLVNHEVQVDGTTLRLAEGIVSTAGKIPVWYDPHGTPGHLARGSSGSNTDADILRQAGLAAAPANGTNRKGKPINLSQIESRNVMHWLMREGRFLVHERCTGLLEAMRKDQRRPDGRIDKRSGPDSESDFRSGHSDSARYGVWPVFHPVFERAMARASREATAKDDDKDD